MQHPGQMKILIGYEHFDEKRFNEAMNNYGDGIALIATHLHSGSYLISDYLNEISQRLTR